MIYETTRIRALSSTEEKRDIMELGQTRVYTSPNSKNVLYA
jgi:hypothetical protein